MFDSDNIIVFDTELTSWPGTNARDWSGPGEHREIVQIGAVKVVVSEDFREIDSFRTYVRPHVNPTLSDYLIELTGITQEMVDNEGVSFPDAQRAFAEFVDGGDCVLCCNGEDDIVLRENCRLNDVAFIFDASRFVNLRPHLAAALDVEARTAQSSDLLALSGLPDDVQGHDALGDARIIVGCLRHLRRTQRLMRIEN